MSDEKQKRAAASGKVIARAGRDPARRSPVKRSTKSQAAPLAMVAYHGE
jgi:hypothetical protein